MSVMAGNADLGTLDWQTRFGAGDGRASSIDLQPARTRPLSFEPGSPGNGALKKRVGQLTAGQRDCLRLVYGHMTSKDIARALGISPHTVDMRLRTAMRTLGVASRIEAARALVDSEGGRQGERGRQGEGAAETYQPLIYQAPVVAGHGVAGIVTVPASTASDEYATQHSDTRFSPAFGPPASGPPRLAGAPLLHGSTVNGAEVRRGPPVETTVETTLAGSLPWGARNTLSPGARLAWIAAIAIGSAMSFGAILGALEALKKLL